MTIQRSSIFYQFSSVRPILLSVYVEDLGLALWRSTPFLPALCTGPGVYSLYILQGNVPTVWVVFFTVKSVETGMVCYMALADILKNSKKMVKKDNRKKHIT